MAKIAWLQLCESAFLDNTDRLCMIGVINRFPVPIVPVAVHQVMLAGRVVDVRPGEELEVQVSITTPSGLSPSPDNPQCIEISDAGEYVLVTLRQLPLGEEGLYRFEIAIPGSDAVVLEIPVFVVSRPMAAHIH